MPNQFDGPQPQQLYAFSPQIVNGAKCAICQVPFQVGDEVIVCPHCRIPHHADCWRANGNACSSAGCQAYYPRQQPVILPPMISEQDMAPSTRPAPWQSVGSAIGQQGSESCTAGNAGCGCLSTLILPILGWIVYKSFESALWVYLLGTALGLLGLLGWIPVEGPFLYWRLAHTIMPKIMEAGALGPTWLTSFTLYASLVMSIIYSVISVAGIIALIVGGISAIKQRRRGY